MADGRIDKTQNLFTVERVNGKEKYKFNGSFEQLKEYVDDVLKISGKWSFTASCGGFHSLKSSTITLSFYISNKTLLIQGPKEREIKSMFLSMSSIEYNGVASTDSKGDDQDDFIAGDAVEISDCAKDKTHLNTDHQDERFEELNNRFNVLLAEVEEIKRSLSGQENQSKSQQEFTKMNDIINMQNLEIKTLKEENKSLLTVIRILSSKSDNSSHCSTNPPIVLDKVTREAKTNNQTQSGVQQQQAARNNTESTNIDSLPKEKHARNRSTTANADVTIIGDSLTKHIDETKLSRKLKVKNVSHSGATVEDIQDYIKPLLRKKPKHVIIHVGTNNLRRDKPKEVKKKVAKLLEETKNNNPEVNVAVSSIVKRNDDPNLANKVIQTPFQVHGFSVVGKVLSSDGQGISDVVITADKDKKTKTDSTGMYILENISTGKYNIQASKEDFFFDVQTVHVNPNTPKLPDIKPSGYNLCGKLVIDVFPAGVVQMSRRKVTLTTEGAPISSRSSSATVNQDGSYCFRVPSGVHTVQPVITNSESNSGLVMKPKEHKVTVTNKPVKDIVFTQFRAGVSGTVKCIGGSCKGVSVSLTSHQEQGKIIVQVFDGKDGATFSFKNVLPGKYKATVVQEMWCWRNKTIDFVVGDEDVTSLEFVQSGFILKCSLSHPITLNFSLENKKEVVGSFDLFKGINRFCLSEPGVYSLVPKSCHRFEQDVYRYNTGSPTVLTLTATQHLMSGVVSTKESSDDLKVKIRSLKTNQVVITGPLSRNKDKDGQGTPTYNFSHWGSKGEEFEVTPLSSTILFYPPSKIITITDDCPGALVQLEGRQGVFIEGQVTPPFPGVEITITSQTTGDEMPMQPIKILTDNNGKYRVGPLHGDKDYHMEAHKTGFIINPVSGKKGYFQAFKLGEIRISVTDEQDKPLPDVLLSLSASQFRKNSLTLDDGAIVFDSLGPGEYFFRPMLKEYTFDPATQVIKVDEGQSVQVKVKGKRVAFSCYGTLASLSGLPEKDVALEAVGLASCEGMQEETRSDKDGTFRLRGLQPGCSYRIRVKTGESNPHIERASPNYTDIQVTSGDIVDVNIITFRKLNQFDVTGTVNTDQQHLHTLKVLLFKESNLDSAILTTTVGIASYFQFPSVPNDGQTYIVRLESSLSRKNYVYDLPETTVVASGIRSHVSLNFHPQNRKFDPEPSQGSLLALPLLVLLVLMTMNYEKVLSVFQQSAQMLQGVPMEQMQTPFDDPNIKNKKKPVQRRR